MKQEAASSMESTRSIKHKANEEIETTEEDTFMRRRSQLDLKWKHNFLPNICL